MGKYLVDSSGNWLGTFLEGQELPAGAVEVPEVPSDSRQKWDGNQWLPLDAATIAKDELAVLDAILPRWAEDLANQGGFTLYGEPAQVKQRKEELRAQL